LGGNIVYKLIIAGIGVLAVALLAMGCGGGGSDEATAQVTKAEFYNQARAICAQTQKKVSAAFRAKASKNLSAAYHELAELRGREAEELESITGSKAVEEEVKPLIQSISEASDLVAREGEAAANDPSLQTYSRETAALHLTEC
jgi:hypothetical protein